jgi:hypothetical protein
MIEKEEVVGMAHVQLKKMIEKEKVVDMVHLL